MAVITGSVHYALHNVIISIKSEGIFLFTIDSEVTYVLFSKLDIRGDHIALYLDMFNSQQICDL